MGFRASALGDFNNAGATKDYTSYSSYTTNDVLMFAIDLDNKKFWYGKNGTWDNSGDPAAGTGQMYSNWTGTPSFYFAHSLGLQNNSVELVGYLVPGTTYSLPYTISNLEDVDTTTTPPTDGQSIVWASGVDAFVPGTRVKSDTTLAGAGASGVSNIVTISQTDY